MSIFEAFASCPVRVADVIRLDDIPYRTQRSRLRLLHILLQEVLMSGKQVWQHLVEIKEALVRDSAGYSLPSVFC